MFNVEDLHVDVVPVQNIYGPIFPNPISSVFLSMKKKWNLDLLNTSFPYRTSLPSSSLPFKGWG